MADPRQGRELPHGSFAAGIPQLLQPCGDIQGGVPGLHLRRRAEDLAAPAAAPTTAPVAAPNFGIVARCNSACLNCNGTTEFTAASFATAQQAYISPIYS